MCIVYPPVSLIAGDSICSPPPPAPPFQCIDLFIPPFSFILLPSVLTFPLVYIDLFTPPVPILYTVQWAPKIMTAHLIIIATSLCVYWLLHESSYPPVPSYVHLPSMLDHFILTLALPLLCSVFDLFIPPDPSYFFPQCLVSLYLPLPYSFSVFDLFIPPVPSYFFPPCLNSLYLPLYILTP